MFIPEQITTASQFGWKEEAKRWAFLAAVATWIFQPFATRRMIGTGDALWYANMLADFVLQWREGVFPVFVGQTEYAFNGAVYPLRAAPLYQHLGGILDLLTGRHLSFFALQHLIVVVVGIAAIVSCYTCLTALAPQRRWPAALLTALYITCPGVLGVIFIQDLYMSWTTLPFLPLIVFGMVRSYQQDDYKAWSAISVGLGGTWLAHAPIALWMTVIAGTAQLIRLLFVNRTVEAWKRALLGGGLLLALGHYPFVSIYSLQGVGSPPASGEALEHPEKIVSALHDAFPGCLLPLSAGAGQLSDLQLGYGLSLVLLLGGMAFASKRRWRLGIILACASAVILILLPIPFWSETFWLKLAPEAVRRLTYYWPMHRLYPILATLAIFVGILGVEDLSESRKHLARFLISTLALGCIWSLWESRQFQTAGTLRTASAEDTERKQRPENRLLMNHAYGLFSKLPPTFSNGVMDPSAEFRLLDPKTFEPFLFEKSNSHGATVVAEGEFTGSLNANPGILNLTPSLTLSPRKHYDLEFTFQPLDYTGILQIVGTSFFREYALPSSGEAHAFGTLPSNSPSIPLWSTYDTTENLSLRFIPTSAGVSPMEYSRFAHFRLFEREESASSIQVLKWAPLTLTATVPFPALLETPRMFIPGYHASVDGKQTVPLASPSGLTAVPVSSGTVAIEIKFFGSPLLRASYWASLVAWTATFGLIIFSTFVARRIRN